MVNKCCVPGCDSNYDSSTSDGYVPSFGFPKGEAEIAKWIRAIPRENLVPTAHTVVCANHFSERDIIKYDILPTRDGEIRIPRKRFQLRSGAVPSIFPNLPGYLSSDARMLRPSPSKRRRKYEDHMNSMQEEWISSDKISNFDAFSADLDDQSAKFAPLKLKIFQDRHADNILFFGLLSRDADTKACPRLKFCVDVKRDMTISVWHHGLQLQNSDLSWANLQSGVLKFWSQLENVLAHLARSEGDSDYLASNTSKVNEAIRITQSIQCGENNEIRKFVIEQLQLLIKSPSQRRFSTDLMVLAFTLHFKSASVYDYLRVNCCILPSSRLLRKLSADISPTLLEVETKYLRTKAQYLNSKELYVNILLDEIHVKPLLSYKNGGLVGCADSEIATTVHCFMISSIFSSNKDIVRFLPTKKMSAEILVEYVKSVLTLVRTAGYTVISIITDGNRINKKMFRLLAGVGRGRELPVSITDPLDSEGKIFLLFDSVHLLKCIRNNWINLTNLNHTFTFPDFDDDKLVRRASFDELEQIYLLETDLPIKQAPQLCWKALHPHSLERQNVALALKVFNDTNVAALMSYGPGTEILINWEDTAKFINLICKWWDMVNVHHPYKGRNTRNQNALPFRDSNDTRLVFLVNLSKWLDKWAANNRVSSEGFLTLDTYSALKHTLKSLKALIEHLLNTLKFEFVLTGKFQTDNLEGRFGQYRQMSGGNRLVSVREILESEHKLRIQGLLKLYPPSGEISVKLFLSEFSEVRENPKDDGPAGDCFVETFPYDEVSFECDSLPVLVYIAGYIATKVKPNLKCYTCRSTLSDSRQHLLEAEIDPSVIEYFDQLNRGGLTYPSSDLLHVLQSAYCIFNVAISAEMIDAFLKLSNQKKVLIRVNNQFWKQIDSIDVDSVCTKCGVRCLAIHNQCIGIFINILLNNYTKSRNDNVKYTTALSNRVEKF